MPSSSMEKISNDVMAPGEILTIRNRYFSGKYLTAADFNGEQNYFLSRSRLRNRMFHGWGMVEGLRVTKHPDPNCRQSHVVVSAGVAIDCYGREVILLEDTVFRLPQKLLDEMKSSTGGRDHCYGEIRCGFVLFLSYEEEPIDKLSVLYHEDPTCSAQNKANRVSEVACLSAVSIHDIHGASWETITDYGEAQDSHSDDPQRSEKAGGALHPDCLCGGMVPLAVIGYESADCSGPLEIKMLDHLRIPSIASKKWTRIVDYNWVHGGKMTHSQLCKLDWQLEVTFSRSLKPSGEPDRDGDGINNRTFTVQVIDAYTGEIFRANNGIAFLDPNNPRLAIFQLIQDNMNIKCWNRGPYVVHITLRCDFILDQGDNPVDGNHLRGKCPTGNGTAGGTFESWFRYENDQSSTYASQEAS